MIHQDYILRMIEQLVRFLAQILFRKKTGNFEEAFQEIDSAVKNILGLDYGLLDKLSSEDIFSIVRKDELYSGIKLLILGKLIKEAAEIKLLKDGNSIPVQDYHKALTLMLEGVLSNTYHEVDLSNFYPDIKELDNLTINYKLPDPVYFQLFRFYELIGDYENAEIWLLELKGSNYPGITNTGQKFYEKLLSLGDDDLRKCNLIREELLEKNKLFLI